MKTYMIYTASSDQFKPLHTFQAAGFKIEDGVYIFHDEVLIPLHASAVAPGVFVKTAE